MFLCKEFPDSDFRNSFPNSEELEPKFPEIRIPKINLMAEHCSFGFGEKGGAILQRLDPSVKEVNENPFGKIFGNESENYETRALCLVEVLENLRKEEIPGSFFLYLLQQVQEIIANPRFGEIGKMKALVIFHVLAIMCEKLGPAVLKNTGHMIQFIHATLSRAHHVYMESLAGDSECGLFELETLTMALGMLSALLGGAVKVSIQHLLALLTHEKNATTCTKPAINL